MCLVRINVQKSEVCRRLESAVHVEAECLRCAMGPCDPAWVLRPCAAVSVPN